MPGSDSGSDESDECQASSEQTNIKPACQQAGSPPSAIH